MTNVVRRLLLGTHILVSVGWIGAVAAYLVLVIAATTYGSEQMVRGTWLALELVGWYGIVPLAIAALLTGVAVAVTTPWGVFRHYWVVISLVLTTIATAVLLQHMPRVSFFASVAADPGASLGALRSSLRGELLHAGVGLLVLIAVEMLNVYKPRGMTAFGRKRSASAGMLQPASVANVQPRPAGAVGWPRWVHVVWLHAVALALLFAIVHLTTGGHRSH